jgi:hypothetical protein
MPYSSSGFLPAGTLIQTAAGLKAVEDIKVGDQVIVPSPERNRSLERTKSSPALFVRSLAMLAEAVTGKRQGQDARRAIE